MSSFASAAFVGLILRRMALAGLEPPPDVTASGLLARALQPGGNVQVALALKQALLRHAAIERGAGFLLGIGQGIHDVPSDPTLDVLRRAASAADLLLRWQRLESYHHSHHRTRIEALDEAGGTALLRHVSLGPTPPAAVEDIVVLGLLAALFQAIGCRGLEIDLIAGNGTALAAMRDDRILLDAALPADGTAQWRLRWRQQLLDTVSIPRDAAEGLIERLYALFDDDPFRQWSLGEAGRALGLSSRSLQRRLAEAGAGYAGIQRDARVKRAARAMLAGPATLAEIGYAAGFADQAHFTREFRRVTGMRPAEWRRVALAPPPA
ncbi:AraC family transcriptional regulator [Ferrovibrio sp. MS7]|uniref:helix-turn-helix transcriptional regulator n=1 Tax=Ferrovibrio plantarum TaxID=3119164 RepID=UPI003134F22E